MHSRPRKGVPFRTLNVIEEFNRECWAVKTAHRFTLKDVLKTLAELFLRYGVPVHIRSNKGFEFTVRKVHDWLAWLNVRPLFIEQRSPWKNGFFESVNGKKGDELLEREIFYSIKEIQVLLEMWR